MKKDDKAVKLLDYDFFLVIEPRKFGNNLRTFAVVIGTSFCCGFSTKSE